MADPLIGKVLGDYTIIELLGRGGMARVYRGYDEKLDRFAAVKVIDVGGNSEELEEYQTRFTREARAIARLRHPNIVGIYQFGQVPESDVNFMAMHFVEGQDLRYILREYAEKEQVMPPETAFRIVRDIALALDYAHRAGVIHRDIKPSNIMVTPEGKAILTDFGLALNIPEGTIGNTFGSAHYIAPEQAISSAQAVPQSDFYSLGVVMYEIFTGKVPFDDPSTMSVALKHLNEPPPLPSTINPDISPEVENVIMHALRKEPQDRYPSGAAMVEALAAALKLQAGTALEDDEDTGELEKVTPAPTTIPLAADAPEAVVERPAGEAHEDTDTVVSAPLSRGRKSPRPARRGRLRRRLLLLILGVIAAGGALLIQNRGGWLFSASRPASPTSGSVAGPGATATGQAAGPSPTETETPPTTATPLADADLLMVYDDQSFLLVNNSRGPLDVQFLEFVRVDPETGETFSFQASDWDTEFASSPPSALPAGHCYQVWRRGLSRQDIRLDYTRYCQTRAAWWTASQIRWFWIDDAPGASFAVTQLGEVLATCSVAEGQCAASFPR